MSFFNFSLNPQQAQVFARFEAFTQPTGAERAFILKGYAGTGKTTLVKGMVKLLSQRESTEVSLLATTGRAAKVLATKTESETQTVHGLVYTFSDLNDDIEAFQNRIEHTSSVNPGQLKLVFSPIQYQPEAGVKPAKHRFYLVDESSMITDRLSQGHSFATFGDGRLLRDLLAYDPEGKFVFIGDTCQLPPVASDQSPALEATYLEETFGLQVLDTELTQVMRQGRETGILQASLALRQRILSPNPLPPTPTLAVKEFQDDHLRMYPNLNGVYQTYLQRIKQKGDTYTVLICHSNFQRQKLNQMIRKELGYPDPQPRVGELLMVTQNNLKIPVVNGDWVRILEIGSREQRAGLWFLKVKLSIIDQPDETYESLLVEKILGARSPNLDQAEHQQLIIDFSLRMKARSVKQKSPEFKLAMMEDPYLNALRAVYGYAITGHKAQGGEWEEVFVWQDHYITKWHPVQTYRWWYTVLTRGIKQVHLADDWFIH